LVCRVFSPSRACGFLDEFSTCISVSVSCVIHVLLSGMGFHLRLEVATCITFTLFDFHTCFFSCTIVAVNFGIWCEP
jgi:hypothetical protein